MPLLVGSVESISVSMDLSEPFPSHNVTPIRAMAMMSLNRCWSLLTLRQKGTPAGAPLLLFSSCGGRTLKMR